MTSNRPVDDWARLLGDTVAVTPLLDRLLHHGHRLKFDGKSWRLQEAAAAGSGGAGGEASIDRVTSPHPRPAPPQVGGFDPATGGGL